MRTRMLLAAGVVLAVAVVAAGLSTASARGPSDDEEPGLHLALGDSLAVGTGASNEERLGYVPRVFRIAHLVTRGEVSTLANLAAGGETSGTFINDGQMAAALSAIADPDTDTQLVTIDIGGDDVLPLLTQEPCASEPTGAACQGIVATRLAGFAGNLPTILGSLQAALAADPGDEQLMVMTYYNPFSGTGSAFEVPVDGVLFGLDGSVDCAANVADPRNAGLNDIIVCVGQATNATVVDVYPAFEGRGALLTHITEADVHPNNLGHLVIALQFLRAARG